MGELLEIDRPLDFAALGELREYLQRLLDKTDGTLNAFYVPSRGGFAHRLKPGSISGRKVWSKASTATCIALLCATGRLDDEPWGAKHEKLIETILDSNWDSARLGKNNAFAISFLLEALDQLGGEQALPPGGMAIVRRKLKKLVGLVGTGESEKEGGVALESQDYEPTAFLTYKAVSALKRWKCLGEVREAVERWNWNHLNQECLLVASASADADVFEVAYSVLIASAVAKLDEMTPQHRALLQFATDQFFAAQQDDGTWPRSRPLFVYVKLGHAYCYDYELLAALLSDEQLRPLASRHLGRLRRAAHALAARKYPLATSASGTPAPSGWSSGHHGTNASAESWASAAALHFCFALGQLVAEKILRETFLYVGASYEPSDPPESDSSLPDNFLDSHIRSDSAQTLKPTLAERLVAPLQAVAADLNHGKQLREETPGGTLVHTSAIFYGPPGTSKTQLAEMLAKKLGWPLLVLDPSHLTGRGLDAVHSEASVLFGKLQCCERVVVLLDEFDELVREREGGSEMESRFLTTAMLPKLAALSNERRIVYLVATNHLEQFDAAIRRPGRFGLILPVMPPTAAEKERHWPRLSNAIDGMNKRRQTKARADLEDLVFLEAEELERKIDAGDDPEDPAELLAEATSRCTMRQPVDPQASHPTWKARMKEQESRIRGID